MARVLVKQMPKVAGKANTVRTCYICYAITNTSLGRPWRIRGRHVHTAYHEAYNRDRRQHHLDIEGPGRLAAEILRIHATNMEIWSLLFYKNVRMRIEAK